ncbi:MAG: signal peptide peptidase SppA [Prolixibacteraceae bacterium]|jgi:protease IV|nr:signal peptide peptidase SppA [Prolixibacteraceae bacterium]MBT6006642.1 signal peptide peptidase SppA [Prolixibacteraceae bacterium]MBT6765157.1 signal peptide peptidase SppA [Prolixibacteraceae bacterium]MBT7000339.1 signal peptide peptidase SppA [Prolixibacteraceae bacterium]MBT7395415.1 signal peptide peptidase SppA [Prolixibacteraceae bacterium]
MKGFFKYVLATIVGIIAISIIGFFFFFIIIGALVSSTEKQVSVQNNSMLVLNLDRQIVDRAPNDPFEDLDIPGFNQAKMVGMDDITKSLEKAVDDDRIKGVYLKLSVVNGGMATVEEIRNALIAFKDSCDKPIYAHAEKFLLGQKAYYLATVADKIVIHPEVAVDFRGIGGEMMFYKNALKKIGVEMQIVRHGKFKAAVEPFLLDKMSEENREQQLTYMGSLWNHMLNGISEKRNISIEQLNALADEVQTFNKGNKAVKSGLVDEVKYKDEVLNDLREITGIKGTKGVPVISASNYADVPVKTKGKGYSRNKVAVIYASGDIGLSFGGEYIDGDKLSKEIRKVRQDSSYKAIVLRIDSPGGTIFDSETIWREVELASDEKTLVVSFGDVAASGGYYIACPADKIVASPNTITGSIGIFGQIPNIGELLNDKLGISTDVVKTNKNSDLLTLTRPMTDYERQMMQANIEDGYNTFISHVADGRGMTKEQVDEIGQGRVWSGENAIEIGLIDEFGGLQDAINLAVEMEGLENYRTVSLPYLPDPFEELFKVGSDNIRARFIKNELGEKYRYYEYFKKASQMNGIYARMPYDLSIN